MKLANTTGELIKFDLSDPQRVRLLREHGFRYIDLSLYDGTTPDWRYLQPDWEDQVAELAALKDEIGVEYVQAHAPGHHPYKDPMELMVATTSRAIEICGRLGIPQIVYHALFRKNSSIKEHFALNRSFIEALIPALEKAGVSLCLENSCSTHGAFYRFFDGGIMREFLEEINHPLVNACWDTGHANIEGHQYADLLALGPRLKAVHIHDNFGKLDEHFLPFSGTLNMDEVMHGLIDAKYEGYFTFECDSRHITSGNWLHKRNRFEGDSRLLEPSLPMYLKSMELMKEIGAHILKSYDLYEE